MGETVRREFNENEISELNVEIGAAELIFVENDREDVITVILKDGDTDIFSTEKRGECLEIFYKKNVKVNKGDELEQIVVMLPGEKRLKNISLTSGAGETNIPKPGLWCDNMRLVIGAGKLKAEQLVVSDNMKVEIGAGKAKLENVHTSNLMIEVGVGKCSYRGAVERNMKVECGVGKVEAFLSAKESDYNYNISCGLGKVKVNGKSFGTFSSGSEIVSAQAKGDIHLECGLGKISIETE